DDLHERAGSTKVLHLHGEILKMRSEKNERLVYDITGNMSIGDTAEDGAQLRPHIVWFEEPVPMIEEAIAIAGEAEYFVVVGTSLVVYPAAGLLHYVPHGIPKFIIDKKIPYTSPVQDITVIEKLATEGVGLLAGILKDLKFKI
ncbi:MAG TPA: Sir2 family NAD-dependent protein deacetylase, partial [Agriterribacter sp.]|nr:Sir2 family NAD-dependent protein deacetylase [Agriterribacter sp.]